jgi:RND family efflux transporter MFP subunit
MNDARPAIRRSGLRVLASAVVCVAILAASAAAIVVINRTEPTAQQVSATRKSAALVETVTVERGTYAPRLAGLGVVTPVEDIVVSPRVGGQVIELSPQFVPGGMVRKGEMLLRIDPADFENALSIRESELQQVKASLEIEEGRQSLARKELDLLGETIDETNRALVLREPQLTSIQAEVAASEAALQRARLDLDRTRVVAPFDAQILSRSVNVGSQVAPGDDLGRLVGIDEYWIETAVPVRNLRWLQFPTADEEGSQVIVRDSDAWGPDAYRQARVTRMIGSLDEQTRLARVLVTVSDPLARQADVPTLILDTLVDVEIEGRPIDGVVRLSREYVRDGDTVWIMAEDKLEIRKVEVLVQDAQFAYVQNGLATGEEVVTSTLATVADGVGLRKISDASSPQESFSSEVVD